MAGLALPDLGQPIEDVRRAQPDDLRCWSVTTIIGVLDKPALVYWSAEQTALAAVHQQDSWAGMAKRDPDEAVKWLTGARFRTDPGQRTAADLGTAVHAALEDYLITGKPNADLIDDEVRPFFEQADRWLQRFSPTILASEVTVYHPGYGYAGTTDGFMVVGGARVIFDWKTSRKSRSKGGKRTAPYPEVALQLAAYRHAEMAAVWRPRRVEANRRRYYLLSPAEQEAAVPVPEVDGGLAIHITPDHCDAYPVECGPEMFEAFCFVQECARWTFEVAPTLIGDPLVAAED